MSMPAGGGSAISTWRGQSIRRFFATANFRSLKSALKFHHAYLGRSALSDFVEKKTKRDNEADGVLR